MLGNKKKNSQVKANGHDYRKTVDLWEQWPNCALNSHGISSLFVSFKVKGKVDIHSLIHGTPWLVNDRQ